MRDAMFCAHANEVPTGACPCDKDCYCKEHTCRGRISVADVPVMRQLSLEENIWLQAWLACADSSSSLGTPAKWADQCLVDFRKRFR